VKIISGGQTGVDRAALDVALKHGIESGGWCPPGHLDEFGTIPDRYPVKELEPENKEGPSPDRPGGLETVAPWKKRGIFAERTLANVRDSDGTIILYCDELRGGTEYTVKCCQQLLRPHELIDASRTPIEEAARSIADFVREKKIEIVNVAGPRHSEWPDGYEYAFRALDIFLNTITSTKTSKTKSKSKRSTHS
jgi:hypothetical protein